MTTSDNDSTNNSASTNEPTKVTTFPKPHGAQAEASQADSPTSELAEVVELSSWRDATHDSEASESEDDQLPAPAGNPDAVSGPVEPAPEEPPAPMDPEIVAEQEYVDMLFGRLDNQVAQAQERLREVQLRVDPSNPDPEDLVRRETEYHGLNATLDQLNIAQLGLVFGRIDVESDPKLGPADNPLPDQPGMERRYIGRMGMDAREDNYRTLLLDWRAPMARPFYLATTAQPEGVHVRRHIRTKGRTVVGIDDEVMVAGTADVAGGAAGDAGAGVAGEQALLHALNQARTQHMSSIVETIQREQDDIIRDPTRGVMVVEGGPGTGKTAVALHRVAYLLYTWREQLEKTGVLIIGPNRTFLDYISRVLPELGETGVVLATVGTLYPGITGDAEESLITREIKGSEEMVHILTEAVKARQTVPTEPVELRIEGVTLTIDQPMIAKARTRARRSRQPHNKAQEVFLDAALDGLVQHYAHVIGADPLEGKNLLSEADVAQLREELAANPQVLATLREYWPLIDPVELVATLLSDEEVLAQAASAYDEETMDALYRAPGSPFTPADVALIDETAFIIGLSHEDEDDEATWRRRVEEAQDALDTLESSSSTDLDDGFDAEVLSAQDVIDAESLALRHQDSDHLTTAARAAADHQWTYGHVIVDEAQELTPMEWRMIMRRSPNRWMTVVGDTAQTSSPAGVEDWHDAFEPYVKNRVRYHGLSINYRTPKPVADIAAEVLALIDPDATPAVALRDSELPVRFLPADTDPDSVVADLQASYPGTLVTAITPANVVSVKGLEYDHVVLTGVEEIIESSPNGVRDLYVAITRATQSLTIIGAPAWREYTLL